MYFRSCLETGGNLGRKFHAGFARQAEDHFRGGDGVRIDPVDIGEGSSADVVVDADENTILETFEASAMNAVAFQNDRRLVTAHDAARMHDLIGKREGAVDAGDAIVQNNIGVLAHGAQHLAASQG